MATVEERLADLEHILATQLIALARERELAARVTARNAEQRKSRENTHGKAFQSAY